MAASGKMAKGLAAEVVHDQSAPTMGMSGRQLDLDHQWRFYRCAVYEGRRVDWNGHERLGKIEHDMVATSGFMPAGFYDAGQTLPLKFRKPTAPYYMARVVVDRFTSLLFSSKRHPSIKCDDLETDDWLTAWAEATRLWSHMIQARTYGGAMGSCALGFKVVEGKPSVEVHDPRWCTPVFIDRTELTVKSMEKRYQFKEDERDDEGRWIEVWYWYRRVIDEKSDAVWPKVKVEAGIEPVWGREEHERVDHNYGFCPIVWLQNKPVEDDVDGDADCHGIFELIESVDALIAQANRGTLASCDPTLVLSSDSEWDSVKKGSGNALLLERGGSATYLELQGSGPKTAMELAEKLEEKALTVARCFLDTNNGGPSRTVEEVEHNYSSMIEQADVMREQYGERGVKRLFEMVLKAARGLGKARAEVGADGSRRIVRSVIKLPPKREEDPETKVVKVTERVLGNGEYIELVWPNYFEAGGAAILQSVQAASQALTGGLIDAEHATRYVAQYFGVEDIQAMLEKIEKKKAEEQAAFMGTALGGEDAPVDEYADEEI
jgi:hypothetical protein